MIKNAVVVALFLSLAATGLAQDGRWSIGLSAVDLMAKQTSGNGVTLIPTNNVGFLATGRMRLSHWSAIEANWSRGGDSQNYYTTSLNYRVLTTLNEFSGAFVVTPMQRERYKPFLLVGGGVIVFNPDNTLTSGIPQSLEGVRQTRPAILYGGGLDYRLIGSLFLRAQYRGLFYTPPDFQLPGVFTGGRGHLAEPGIGLVFRF